MFSDAKFLLLFLAFSCCLLLADAANSKRQVVKDIEAPKKNWFNQHIYTGNFKRDKNIKKLADAVNNDVNPRVEVLTDIAKDHHTIINELDGRLKENEVTTWLNKADIKHHGQQIEELQADSANTNKRIDNANAQNAQEHQVLHAELGKTNEKLQDLHNKHVEFKEESSQKHAALQTDVQKFRAEQAQTNAENAAEHKQIHQAHQQLESKMNTQLAHNGKRLDAHEGNHNALKAQVGTISQKLDAKEAHLNKLQAEHQDFQASITSDLSQTNAAMTKQGHALGEKISGNAQAIQEQAEAHNALKGNVGKLETNVGKQFVEQTKLIGANKSEIEGKLASQGNELHSGIALLKNDLSSHKANYESDKIKNHERLGRHSGELQNLSNNSAKHKADLDQTNANIGALKNDIHGTNEENLKKFSEQGVQLREQKEGLTKANENLGGLRQTFAEHQQQFGVLDNTVKAHEGKILGAHTELGHQHGRIKALEEKVPDVDRELHALGNQHRELSNKVNVLNGKHVGVADQLQKHQTDYTNFQTTVNTELGKTRDDVAEWQKKHSALADNFQRHQTRFTDFHNNFASHQTNWNTAKSENDRKLEQLNQLLSANNEKIVQQKGQFDESINNVEQEIQQLDSKFDSKLVKKLAEQREQLDGSLDKMQQTVQQLDGQLDVKLNAKLSEQKEQFNEALNKVQYEVQQLDDKFNTKLNGLQAEVSKVVKLEEQLLAEKNAVHTVKGEVEKLKADVNKIEANLSAAPVQEDQQGEKTAEQKNADANDNDGGGMDGDDDDGADEQQKDNDTATNE